MAIPVEMPKMSDTMEEGVVVAWMVEEGQEVSAGDVIAQVETDKATMDLEVYDDGVLLKQVIEEGDAVPIGGLIAILGKKDEDISDILARYSSGGDGTASSSVAQPEAAGDESPDTASLRPVEEFSVSDGRVKSSPLARRMARDHGIDLAEISGSGPEGRIIKRDIEDRIGAPIVEIQEPAPMTSPPPVQTPRYTSVPSGDDSFESIRITQMRKAISRRLSESKFGSPHFYLTADMAMEKAVAARIQINEIGATRELAKVSVNDLVTKACALALREHRWVNASYLEHEAEVRLHNEIHVAVAVAVDDGLITPVIRHADRKGLTEIAAETRSLAERARAKDLQPEEYSGSTFTTSNLGMFGIEEFTAIINPPNACILAIGAIRDVAVVSDGEVTPGKRMKVTLSCDHRVVDGVRGAEFLATVRSYIEDPLAMLL